MNYPGWRIPLLLLGMIAPVVCAQDMSSIMEGAISFVVPSGQARSISLPLHKPPSGGGQVVGRITAVGAGYLENANAGWTPAAFSGSNAPYFVRLTSGPARGRTFPISTITSLVNTSTRLNVVSDDIALDTLGIETGSLGDGYEIFAADTLLSLFGSGLLMGGASSLEADNVLVWGGGSYICFYYNTVRTQWERDNASANRNDFPLHPDRGIMIVRRGASDLKLTITGRVPRQDYQLSLLPTGFTLASTGFPVSTTLSTLALHSPARIPNWRGVSDTSRVFSEADYVQVWGGGSWLIFYYNTTNQRWQREGDEVNRDGFVISVGLPIYIRRMVPGSSAADLTLARPVPYAN